MRKSHHFLYQVEGQISVLFHKSSTFLTIGTPLKWQWHSLLQYRSAHPSLMPSSSCRCWKARRPWWALWAKGKPSSLLSTFWEVKEHWAPSVSTCPECGLHSWTYSFIAVAFKVFDLKWKPKLGIWHHTWPQRCYYNYMSNYTLKTNRLVMTFLYWLLWENLFLTHEPTFIFKDLCMNMSVCLHV